MFWENFLKLCNKNNESPNNVCNKLKLSNATATKWKNGSVPRNTTLLKIAEYFGVTVEYLLGETDIKEKPSELTEDDELVAEFAELINGLTDDQMKSVFDYIQFIKTKNNDDK